jgi:hypothetical protein
MAESKSKSSSSQPKRVLSSDITGLEQQHNLTRAEAERVANGESVDSVKSERTVFRPRYEALEANPAFHPLAAADAAAERREAEAEGRPAGSVGPDPALPQSGPYGPNAEYAEVSTPEDKDHLTGAAAAEAAAKQAK